MIRAYRFKLDKQLLDGTWDTIDDIEFTASEGREIDLMKNKTTMLNLPIKDLS